MFILAIILLVNGFIFPLNATEVNKEFRTMQQPSKYIASGFIVKEGSRVKNWKRRWFTFSFDGTLSYYTDLEV